MKNVIKNTLLATMFMAIGYAGGTGDKEVKVVEVVREVPAKVTAKTSSDIGCKLELENTKYELQRVKRFKKEDGMAEVFGAFAELVKALPVEQMKGGEAVINE